MNLILLEIISIIQKGNQKNMRLATKTALITGGSTGIGLATAEQVVNEGAYVFVTGRCERGLAEVGRETGEIDTPTRADVSARGEPDRPFPQSKATRGQRG